MSNDKLYKPGEITEHSGLYEETGPRGGSKGIQITSTKGHPLPPTSEAGNRYRPVDLAKHKSGK